MPACHQNSHSRRGRQPLLDALRCAPLDNVTAVTSTCPAAASACAPGSRSARHATAVREWHARCALHCFLPSTAPTPRPRRCRPGRAPRGGRVTDTRSSAAERRTLRRYRPSAQLSAAAPSALPSACDISIDLGGSSARRRPRQRPHRRRPRRLIANVYAHGDTDVRALGRADFHAHGDANRAISVPSTAPDSVPRARGDAASAPSAMPTLRPGDAGRRAHRHRCRRWRRRAFRRARQSKGIRRPVIDAGLHTNVF